MHFAYRAMFGLDPSSLAPLRNRSELLLFAQLTCLLPLATLLRFSSAFRGPSIELGPVTLRHFGSGRAVVTL